MIFLQLLALLFSLFMMYVVRIHYLKKNVQSVEYGLWVMLWTVFACIAVFPETFRGIAQSLRIVRVFDLLVMLAMMFITFLLFHNYVQYRKIEMKLEQLVRDEASENIPKIMHKKIKRK